VEAVEATTAAADNPLGGPPCRGGLSTWCFKCQIRGALMAVRPHSSESWTATEGQALVVSASAA